MGSGFSKMKKQARLLEEQLKEANNQRAEQRYTGTSGAGLVSIVINGEKKVQGITIKPECVDPTDVEGLQDLIVAAFADAMQKCEESNSQNSPLASLPFQF